MKRQSKRYQELLKSSVKNKKIELKEIIDLVKKNSTTKFDESIDVSLRINLKQSKGGDLSLRTVVKLPNGSGKKSKVAVLCEPDKIEEAKKSGKTVHFGTLMDLCFIKHAELKARDPEYKGRCVFRGDQVTDETDFYAVFSEQGTSASHLAAAKFLDAGCNLCFWGHSTFLQRFKGETRQRSCNASTSSRTQAGS